jgi:hypothetical protein
MKHNGFILCFLLFALRIFAQMHPAVQIAFVKQQLAQQNEPYRTAYIQLLHYADSILGCEEHALADFAVPGYYDKPQEHRANSLAIQYDAFGAYATALAYRLSGEKRYGKKAVYFLNAWAEINKKYSEHDGVLVMAYSGSGLMIAAELMNNTKLWKKREKKKFETWVKTVYQSACNEIRTAPHTNNWADWGRFGSLLAASFLNDKNEVAENVRLIKSDLFDKILPDGSMPEETRRGNNGIWYTYFSLAPMTAACWVAYNLTGENLFALEQNGASIKKAIDCLFYYEQNPQEWPFHSHPNTGNNEPWCENLIEAMAGVYNNSAYADFAKQFRPIIYPKHHFAWVFPTLMPVCLTVYGNSNNSER